jgi:hypothetical protein
MMRAAMFAVLAIAAHAAHAEPSTAPAAVATIGPAHAAPSGLAVGVELGEPAALTVAWYRGALGFAAGLGTGTFAGAGVSMHAGLELVVARLAPHVPVRVGLGGRYYRHGYDPMSIDEIPDTHLGIRAAAAVALERGPLQLYAELAPGLDVRRTQSCTLASGPDSICPHAQDSPVFLQAVVGARWFLSH